VREPVRRGVQTAQSQEQSWLGAYRDFVRFMRSRPRFFLFHYLGFGFATAVVVSGGGWYPVHMIRSFGWTPGQTGLYLGLTVVSAAVVGKPIAGRVMDMMYERGYRDAQMRWYAGCLVAAIPVGVFALTRENPWLFLGGLWLFLLLLQPFAECAFTALNLVTPNHLRGAGVAFFGATAGLLGGSAGPMLPPAASTLIFHSESALGLGLATVVAVCSPIAAVFLALGMRPMREAVAEAERTSAG